MAKKRKLPDMPVGPLGRHSSQLSRAERAESLALEEYLDIARPRTRADCVCGPRPCPWVGCRHHLALELTVGRGRARLCFDPFTAPASCALDLADMGGMSLEAVGAALHLTRERVRQIEEIALDRAGESSVLALVHDGSWRPGKPRPRAQVVDLETPAEERSGAAARGRVARMRRAQRNASNGAS